MARPLWLTLLGLSLAALLLYAGVLALLWWKQERLMFYPVPLPADYPLATAPDVHEVTVPVDGARLSVLHLRLPQPRGVVFFLHGNAGNLAGWFSDLDFYRQANYDLVMPDYRGFGKSTGHIALPAQLRRDVRAAWDTVANRYAGRKVVLYGRSLGTALAAELAADLAAAGRPPALTVLVSPYTSMRDLTAEFYPWVPSFLVRYPLDTAAHIGAPFPRRCCCCTARAMRSSARTMRGACTSCVRRPRWWSFRTRGTTTCRTIRPTAGRWRRRSPAPEHGCRTDCSPTSASTRG